MSSRIKTRWIRIGRVNWPWFVRHYQWGCPRGYVMHWQGRVSWCQPLEFLNAADLVSAVRRRLRMARLELMAIATEATDELWKGLLCQVRRARSR